MRVAVTAKEASVESQVDQRFGRARYLVVCAMTNCLLLKVTADMHIELPGTCAGRPCGDGEGVDGALSFASIRARS